MAWHGKRSVQGNGQFGNGSARPNEASAPGRRWQSPTADALSAAGTRNLSELRILLQWDKCSCQTDRAGRQWKLGEPEVRIERLPVNRDIEPDRVPDVEPRCCTTCKVGSVR